MAPIRLAVLDTETAFVRVLANRAEAAGWEIRAPGAAPAPDALAEMRLNAVVVDADRLGPRVWDYLERVAAAAPRLGVVVCSSPSTVAERVRGLRLGADDWIDKPCHPEEVMARVEAVVRRGRPARPSGSVTAGELQIRPDRYQAFAGERSAELTRREFELLQLLAGSPEVVLPREEIYERAWGYAMAHGDRSVDVFVRKLRQKLAAVSPHWAYIHTHFGVGYRFQPEPLAGARAPADAPAPALL
ncbi:MAG TPA: response regulator transcription factor [Thermoleophilaceae bacterium]|jgi:DNA-binding response OmpR family regulator